MRNDIESVLLTEEQIQTQDETPESAVIFGLIADTFSTRPLNQEVFLAQQETIRTIARETENGCVIVGRCGDIVVMTHPADTAFGNIRKENVLLHVQPDPAVFTAVFGALDRSARHMRHELTAVTDAEDRHACVQDRGVKVRRFGIADAVGTSCEDDAAVACRFDLTDGDLVVGADLGIDVLFAHAARDEPVILTAEIED